MLRALLILAITAAAGAALAQEHPCEGFSWDVSHERALFATTASAAIAGATTQAAPLLEPDKLTELQLSPQSQVTFAAPPGKSRSADGSYAGLARLQLARSGVYRIALDQSAWIDVIDQGQPIASGDYQGRPGCQAPHKIVQFTLPAGRQLLLQLSGAAQMRLKLTVTATDAAH